MIVIETIIVPRREFAEYFLESSEDDRASGIISRILARDDLDQAEIINFRELQKQVASFGSKLSEKFKECRANKAQFCELQGEYLDGEPIQQELRIKSLPPISPTPSTFRAGPGRPENDFSELSDKSRKRKVDGLLVRSPDKLLHAALLASYASGDRAGAKQLRTAADNERRAFPPSTSSDPPRTEERARGHFQRVTPEQALAFFLENKGSKRRYSWIVCEDARARLASSVLSLERSEEDLLSTYGTFHYK